MAKIPMLVSIQAEDWIPGAHLQCWGLRGSSPETRGSHGRWHPAQHVHTSMFLRATSKMDKVKT